jgi:hypothetical protein
MFIKTFSQKHLENDARRTKSNVHCNMDRASALTAIAGSPYLCPMMD